MGWTSSLSIHNPNVFFTKLNGMEVLPVQYRECHGRQATHAAGMSWAWHDPGTSPVLPTVQIYRQLSKTAWRFCQCNTGNALEGRPHTLPACRGLGTTPGQVPSRPQSKYIVN